MKIGKSYTIDEEIIDEIEKLAKEQERSASWIVNEFLKEKLEEKKK